MRSTYAPCLPTNGKAVPATPAWLHEIKYDGYRLIVARDVNRVGFLNPRSVAVAGINCAMPRDRVQGTPITERPPHNAVRAAFPHTAPTSGG